jgi:hypothetical protein
LLVSSRTALQIGSVRAQPVGSSVTVVVQKLADWKVVDMDQPSTPFNITISGSGSVLTVDISGAKTTVAVTREANGKMWIAALNALPNTGAGTDGTSDGRWLAPLAVAGAGFAAIARRVRKHSRSG